MQSFISRVGIGKIPAFERDFFWISTLRLEFLTRNHGRKLREVMDAEIDISDVIQ
jgi:hypothetical protein